MLKIKLLSKRQIKEEIKLGDIVQHIKSPNERYEVLEILDEGIRLELQSTTHKTGRFTMKSEGFIVVH